MKRIKIYIDDVMTHDFELCLREADNRRGYYDHVTGDFLPDPESASDEVVYLDSGTQYIDTGYRINNGTKMRDEE